MKMNCIGLLGRLSVDLLVIETGKRTFQPPALVFLPFTWNPELSSKQNKYQGYTQTEGSWGDSKDSERELRE